MTQRQGQVIDEYQRSIPGATIYVYNKDGTDAVLTYDGSTPLAQPVVSDEFGIYTYDVPDGFYREDTWYGGKLRSREILAVGNPPEAKGDPGGNVMAIGTFAQAPALTVPVGTKLVQVTGTATAGDSGSGRQFIEAAEVTSGFVTANPLIAFRDVAGRGFREIDTRTGAKITPFLLVISGQSSAAGANNGGPNPASPGVKTWDGATGTWGGSDYTATPWSRTAPDGNGSNNNYGLAAAHRIYEATRRPVYIVFDAVGGTSIDQWVATGTASARYAALKTKVQAALATAQFTSHAKTTIDIMVWGQGEEDFTDTIATHLANFTLLDNQLRAETWFTPQTPIYVTGMVALHKRYPPEKALRYYCAKINNWCVFVPSNAMDTGVNGHFDGVSTWEMGYYRIAPLALAGTENPEIPMLPFYGVNPSGELAPTDETAITTFDNAVNWSSRTDGQLAETYSGDGATTVFTLESRGTIGSITVGGVTKVSPTDYTYTHVPPALPFITFAVAPANAANNIVVTFGVQVDGPRATGGFSWGYKCYADGNFSFAYGDRTYTGNGSNYSMAGGQLSWTLADNSFVWGSGIASSGNYQGAFGRGHTLVDDGTAAVGTFSKYTTTQTDPVVLQVGAGTSDAVRKNAFAVRKSGIVENLAQTVAALGAAGTIGRRAFVTDSNTATFAAVVAGGGTNKVPVWDNGTNWLVG